MKTHLLLVLFVFASTSIFSQVGIGTQNPHPKAVLELSSTEKGLLIPRMTSAQRTAISGAPAGLLVYQTDGAAGFYYSTGSAWTSLQQVSNNGDIKYGYQQGDHNGWYLLDGRSINSLPATAQTAASQLGISANLPNMTDAYVKAKGSSETTGQFYGNTNNSVVLQQSNLPNILLTASSVSAGIPHGDLIVDSASAGVAAGQVTVNSGGDHTHTGTTLAGGDHSHTYGDAYLSAAQKLFDPGVVGVSIPRTGNPVSGVRAGTSNSDGNSLLFTNTATTLNTSNEAAHTHALSTFSAGEHSHSANFVGFPMNIHGHNSSFHGVPLAAHDHSVPLGGSATPIDIKPKSIALNCFIYLGQ